MARRRKDAATISLLPILSIQKCTMGIMVVLICAQNLVSLGETSDQVMEIGGSANPEKVPVYVECQKDVVLIHSTGQEIPAADLKPFGPDMKPFDEIKEPDKPTPFHELLKELSDKDSKKYLVLLIRPEGINTFRRCYILALMREVKVGKEALLSGGKVIFTEDGKPVFTRKKGER
jgi:hypothetical protein